MSGSNLPPVRRIVTGHTPEGKAIVVDDAPIEQYPFRGSRTIFSDLFWTDAAPAPNDIVFKDLTKDHPNEHCPSEGSSFKVSDIPPGQKSPFHRTVTFDYAVLTHGQLTLILDDDKRVDLRPGDVVIQRGTIHAWHNEVCSARFSAETFSFAASQKAKIGETELEAEFRIPQFQATQK
ncbi:hypothetical protein A7U60_g4724 [Sanghuangporus baumii]|uniref:Uncharacterized protein n=1 Tax=Sanghuangporus baumii TaxID=108892 RepID=A0A9Q5NC23_SANBA|nr:hypothetical protein A7U60_g4724 [Sanghuangporus baumii]